MRTLEDDDRHLQDGETHPTRSWEPDKYALTWSVGFNVPSAGSNRCWKACQRRYLRLSPRTAGVGSNSERGTVGKTLMGRPGGDVLDGISEKYLAP